MGSIRAFWLTAPNAGEIREEAPEPLEAGSVRVRALYSAVSRGSELLVYQGRVPQTEYARMRAPFQAGEFSFPVKYGYSSVGLVEEGPADLRGRHVFCLHPHQTAYAVPETAVIPLPNGVPAARAVLAANMETALNALWDAAPTLGDRIAVVGAGAVGCLAAHLASRLPGAEVTLVDLDARKRSIAAALGLPFTLPQEFPGGADLVFHATGAPAGLEAALTFVRPEGKLVELSWFGDRAVALPLGGDFFVGRLSLKASRVGPVSPNRAGWSARRRLELSLRLLSDPVLDALVTAESSFDDLPSTFRRLSDPSHFDVCHRVRYP